MTILKNTEIASSVSVDWLEFTLFNRRVTQVWEPDLEHRRPLSRAERLEVFFGNPEKQFEFVDSDDEEQKYDPTKQFTVEQVCELLGTELGQDLERQKGGKLGYRARWSTSAGVMILADGEPGMGVHVSMTGAVVSHVRDVPGLIRVLIAEGAKFSRIDIAVDDCDGALDLPLMIVKCEQGECSSRLRRYSVVKGGLLADGVTVGLTLYLGKRGSDFMARVYDKRLEQIHEHGAEPDTLPKHWIRFESECKGAAAANVAAMLADGAEVGEMARGILTHYLTFRDRSEDKNKARWPVCGWWISWLAGVDKLSIAKQLKRPTIERRLKWLTRQASPSIAMLLKTLGPKEMTEAVVTAGHNLSDRQRDEIDSYLYEQTVATVQGNAARNAERAKDAARHA